MTMAADRVRNTVSRLIFMSSPIVRRLPVRGRGWIVPELWKRLGGDAWWSVQLHSGARMYLPAGSQQTWIAAFTGGYDDDLLSVLLAHFEPGSMALDVGASLGLYAVRLGVQARETGGRVVAFEPVAANRDALRANLDLNGISSVVEVRPEALGDEDGEIELQVERGGVGNAAITRGVTALDLGRHASAGRTHALAPASVRRLDDLELPALRCSVLKLDVEGCEFQVLRGAEQLVTRDRPVIQGEFSPAWLASRAEDIGWLAEWAVRHDYRLGRFALRRAQWWREPRVELHPVEVPVGGEMLLLPNGPRPE